MSSTDAIICMLSDDFHQSVLPAVSQGLVGRDLSLGKPARPKMGSTAKVVVGVRRPGKTWRPSFAAVLSPMSCCLSASANIFACGRRVEHARGFRQQDRHQG